ncbi:thiazole biosynthesis protein [candidate division WOR-3 bacterium]|nr:thiazole biosynthesis protein [candidate division WOR-3 bacterium]
MLDETIISKAIIETYMNKLIDVLNSDIAIAGAGPSGLTAGYYLKKYNPTLKVILFERKLSIGGGMWGGGMMMNEIVVQEEGRDILDEFGINNKKFEEGYYTADSIEAITTLASQAVKTGLRIFNTISVEDVIIESDRVNGVVINWTPSVDTGLHVDPLAIRANFLIDATGHSSEIAHIIERKGKKLLTDTGKIIGEGAMFADKAESVIIENSKEVFPNLWVCGMAANAVFGGPRMGPIFGGMLLSGKSVAEKILQKIG